MGYTLVIIKIRFENLTRILHFPNLIQKNIEMNHFERVAKVTYVTEKVIDLKIWLIKKSMYELKLMLLEECKRSDSFNFWLRAEA